MKKKRKNRNTEIIFNIENIRDKCIWEGESFGYVEEIGERKRDISDKLQMNLRIPQEQFENEIDEVIFSEEISSKDFKNAMKGSCFLPELTEEEVLEEASEIILKKGKGQRAINDVLDYIIALLNIKLIDGRFCYYEEPIWKYIDSPMVLNQITYGKLDCHDSLDTRQFRELFNSLEGRRYQMNDISTSKSRNSYLICFRNGVYDICADKMLEHSPEYYFFSYLDYNFIPKEIGKGEVFDNYLESLSEENYAIKQRVLEIIGYCCSDMPNLKKIPLFVGKRDSGKTTLTRLIHSIVGEENGVAISLEHINRFSAADLYGKKIGISSDLSGKKLSSVAVEELKLLTGGDVVRVERKGKDAFSFIPTCKILIASNFRPKLSDYDEALEERWVVVPFRKSISQSEKNPNLLEDIIREDVMQHVFYLVFKALRKFIENDFCFTDIGELEMYNPNEEYYSIKAFFDEKCIYQEGTKLANSVLFEEYEKFCLEEELEQYSKNIFGREIRIILTENGFKEDKNGFRGYKNLSVI